MGNAYFDHGSSFPFLLFLGRWGDGWSVNTQFYRGVLLVWGLEKSKVIGKHIFLGVL